MKNFVERTLVALLCGTISRYSPARLLGHTRIMRRLSGITGMYCRLGWVVLCCFLLCIVLLPCSAQHISYRQFTTADGLPADEVHDITQDRQGKIWLATDHGLCSYDGYDFETLTTRDGLSDNTVFRISLDHRGRLWLTTFSAGIAVYERGVFRNAPRNDSILRLLGDNHLGNVYVDTSDAIWFAINDRDFLCRIGPDSSFTYFQTGSEQAGRYAHCVVVLDGVYPMVSSTRYDFQRSDGTEDDLIRKGPYRLFNSWHNHFVKGGPACLLRSGELLLANGAVLLRCRGDVLTSQSILGAAITDMMEDRQGALWLASYNGLYYYPTGRLQDEAEIFFKNHIITSIYQDHENSLWFATQRNGVFFVPSPRVRKLDGADAFGDIVAIASCDSTLIFANSVNEIGVVNFEDGEPRIQGSRRIPPVDELVDRAPQYIYLHHSTLIDGNYEFDLVSGEAAPLPEMGQARGSLHLSIAPDSSFLLAGFGFIKVMDGKVLLNSERFGFLKRCNAALQDTSGCIWLGTNDGLYRYTGDSVQWMGSEYPALAMRIDDMDIDWNGSLVMAGKGAGLMILRAGSLQRITQSEGLDSDLCTELLIDTLQRAIWLVSNSGVNKLQYGPRDSCIVERFSYADGLPAAQIKGIALCGGLLFFATRDGVYYIDPDSLQTNSIPPFLALTMMSVNNRSVPLADYLRLEHDQNEIEFHFNACSFRRRKHPLYRYQLAGRDKMAVLTNNRSVRYAGLASGDYRFRLDAVNESGIMTSNPINLRISINRHFSERPWFIALMTFAALLLTGAFVYAAVRRHQRKEVTRRRLLAAEYKSLRLQMNPHFVFNALNSVQYFIVSNNTGAAKSYLLHFSKLMRTILEHSKRQSVPLGKELEGLRVYLKLEKMRFKEKFDFRISVPPAGEIDDYYIAPMLLQPLLENAILHGIMPKEGPGIVSLELALIPGGLRCTIIDNGIGRVRAAALQRERLATHNSTALRNIHERIALINEVGSNKYELSIQDLYEDSGAATGTKVELTISVHN